MQTLGCLDIADGDLAGAAVFLGIESDFLAFDQSAHAGAFERGGMDENVLAAVVRLNEAEAFLVVVKLHGARIHQVYPFAELGALERQTRNCVS